MQWLKYEAILVLCIMMVQFIGESLQSSLQIIWNGPQYYRFFFPLLNVFLLQKRAGFGLVNKSRKKTSGGSKEVPKQLTRGPERMRKRTLKKFPWGPLICSLLLCWRGMLTYLAHCLKLVSGIMAPSNTSGLLLAISDFLSWHKKFYPNSPIG